MYSGNFLEKKRTKKRKEKKKSALLSNRKHGILSANFSVVLILSTLSGISDPLMKLRGKVKPCKCRVQVIFITRTSSFLLLCDGLLFRLWKSSYPSKRLSLKT
uniref:Uncharacterized protein n=1 Tax=Cacopsylla melanoneura TaxID=428564 RepID=A0A8D8VTX9_9HEMI